MAMILSSSSHGKVPTAIQGGDRGGEQCFLMLARLVPAQRTTAAPPPAAGARTISREHGVKERFPTEMPRSSPSCLQH